MLYSGLPTVVIYMEQIVYLDVSMDMPVTVEISLERVLSPVTGVEALSNVKVNPFL